MAGSLAGLGFSQRVDLNGKPAVGWLTYVYAANSSTPVNTYQDFALTVLNPWPIAADANGMLSPFWVADGAYRTRGTSADGSTTYFDIPSVTAVGPSSGSVPSGGVDPTTIFATGDVLWMDYQGTRAGWVRDNGRTIGSASSGATERANADCQALFNFLWNNFPDAICPVGGGRGGSSSVDWSANKQIATPDKRGYIAGGLDDMGNSAAGRWASVPVINGAVTTAGSTLGEALHTTTSGEMPAHNHSASDSGHTHTPAGGGNFITDGAGTTFQTGSTGRASGNSVTASGFANISIANTGGGGAHNNVQRTVLGTFFRKL